MNNITLLYYYIFTYRYYLVIMFFRRQKTKWQTNSFFGKKIIVEILEIQSKTKITTSIKTIFKRKSSSNLTSITIIQSFVTIFQNIEIFDIFIKILNDRIIDQLKTKFAMIKTEKRRTHLEHFLT